MNVHAVNAQSNSPSSRWGALAILLFTTAACSSGDNGASGVTTSTSAPPPTPSTSPLSTDGAAGGPAASSATPSSGPSQGPGPSTGVGPLPAPGTSASSSAEGGRGGTGPTGPDAGGTSGPTAGGSAAAASGGAPAVATGGAAGAQPDPVAGGGVPNVAGSDSGGSAGANSTPTETACADGATLAHYVDASNGDDANDGSTADSAWQTLDRVNSEMFGPGDVICFRAGATWTGEFAPTGAGSSDAPVVIDRYGEGADPRIDAGQADLQAVLIRNFPYIELNHLEVTNDKGGPGDYRGVSVQGSNAGQISHTYVRNLRVHDVTGEVNWIGGDAADDDPPWVTFKTGWDRSKRTGGIVFETEAGSTMQTWFDDVVIENNVIQDTSFGGIVFKQLEALGGVRNSANDGSFRPHTNIVVRGNFLSQSNTQYGCNTIYITGAQHATVEGNVTRDSGTSSIEIYNSDDVLVQHNETYGTVKKAGGADSNGIDADRATTNTIIQYNYVHDNGDGILLAQFGFGDSVVRYNVIANSSRMGINMHSDTSATSRIYNNLFYGGSALTNTSGSSDLLNGNYDFTNNIFFGTGGGASVRTGGNVTYQNNLFQGVNATGSGATTADPMWSGSATWPSGDESGTKNDELSFLTLQAGSPAIDAGTKMQDDGGLDFFGTALSDGSPDIGPIEHD